LKLALGGLLGGLLLGLILALAKKYGNALFKFIADIYIEALRGTPLILQLFVIYFGLPELGLQFDRITAGWIALAANSAAYQAEYFRGAFNSVESGQLLAAKSLGMSNTGIIFNIVLPQSIRFVMPPWSNEVIYNIKNAAITFTIAVPELLAEGQTLAGRDYRIIEIFLTVTVIYIIVVWIINIFLHFIERKIRIPGLMSENES